MPINYRDPRYQNAVLAGNADPRSNPSGVQANITANWAAQQQGVLNNFKNLAISEKNFNSRLNLAERGLRFDANMFKRRLNNAQDASRQGAVLGLGTSLIAGLIGRDNREKAEAFGLRTENFYRSEALKNDIWRLNQSNKRKPLTGKGAM